MRQQETTYLFVDGGYLRGVLNGLSRDLFHVPIELSPQSLSNGFRKVFYYDCPPEQRDNEPSDDFAQRSGQYESWLGRLRETPGVHVVEGSTSGRRKQRQKQVDVAIAVDMLSHSHRQNMTQATLLSGDLDFKPVVDALVRDGMWVTVWCEQASASRELWLSADSRRDLSTRTIFDVLSDDVLRRFPRPDEFGQRRQADVSVAVRRGYSARDRSTAYLFETPHRWEVILQTEHDPVREGRMGHVDRGFLERYASVDREVVWEEQ
jgi:uncharacterized LabA/DUF88 family protein